MQKTPAIRLLALGLSVLALSPATLARADEILNGVTKELPGSSAGDSADEDSGGGDVADSDEPSEAGDTEAGSGGDRAIADQDTRSGGAEPSKPAVCGRPSLASADAKNQIAFQNWGSSSLGHCWGMSAADQMLRSGAKFAKGGAESPPIAQKLKLLEKGQPQTFTSVSNIRELSQKYSPDMHTWIDGLQKKRFYNLGSLFSIGLNTGSGKNPAELQKVKGMLAKGGQPSLVLQKSTFDQHVVTVVGTSGDNLKIVDSNKPGQVATLNCSGGGCNYDGKSLGLKALDNGDFKNSMQLAAKRGCSTAVALVNWLRGAFMAMLSRFTTEARAEDVPVAGIQDRVDHVIDLNVEGKNAEALAELDAILKESPSLPKMHLLRGEILLGLKRYEDAFRESDKVPESERGFEYWALRMNGANGALPSVAKKDAMENDLKAAVAKMLESRAIVIPFAQNIDRVLAGHRDKALEGEFCKIMGKHKGKFDVCKCG